MISFLSLILLAPMASAHEDVPLPSQGRVMREKAVLSFIHHANDMEIKMGRMAERKGRSRSIRDYGSKLAADHADADVKVKQLASEEGISLEPAKMTDAEQAAMTRLDSIEGSPFDRVFADQMESDHKAAIDKLESDQVGLPFDSKARALVTQILPTLHDHERLAETISAQLPPPEKEPEPAAP